MKGRRKMRINVQINRIELEHRDCPLFVLSHKRRWCLLQYPAYIRPLSISCLPPSLCTLPVLHEPRAWLLSSAAVQPNTHSRCNDTASFSQSTEGAPPPSPECQCTVWISISVCHHHIEHAVFKKEWFTSDRTSFLMIKWFFWTEAAEHKNKNKRGIFEIILIINNPVQKLAAINEYCTD